MGLLTNDLGAFHGPGWSQRMPFLGAADVLVDRSDTAALKPHPEANAAALDALGRSVDEVVFVDDQPHNVEGARTMGMRAVHLDVTDPAGSVDRANEMLDASA